MAGWKSSWNSLAVRLILSFVAVMVLVTAVFSISPYIFVRDTLREGLARRGEAQINVAQGSISGYLLLGMSNSIQSYIAGLPKELEVSYVAVADPSGVFLAHSDPALAEKPWSGKGGIPRGAGEPRGRKPRIGGSASWRWRLRYWWTENRRGP